MQYWLLKTEPTEFSYADLEKSATATCWDGIRNYQARNLIREQLKKGDKVFIYHSSCKNTGIAGTAEVCSETYPDPAQFDVASPYYDAKSSKEKPKWYCMDIKAIEPYNPLISTQILKQQVELKNMQLFKQPRLSVQAISKSEWLYIEKLQQRKSL